MKERKYNAANLQCGEATSIAFACCAPPQSTGLAQHNMCTPLSSDFYSCFLMLESIDVTIRPKPNPASMLPTNARGDSLKKKNPTPRPRSKPPPIAHVLLSSFLPAIQSSLFPSSITPCSFFLAQQFLYYNFLFVRKLAVQLVLVNKNSRM
jgi:hypothetical protein